ncbi:MAG: glycoside hydrolase family 5 protein [Chloroflexota bacterium]
MRRCRLPLILVLGALLALVVAGCGTAQRGSEASPLAAVWNAAAPIGGTSNEKSNDSKAGTPDKANASNRAASGKVGSSGKPNFLSTRGAKIVDADGKEVKITGINWFGLETGTFAPHGLWSRNLDEMLDQVAELGFNTIRLPYSNQALEPSSKVGEGVDFKFNPDLEGLTGLEVMDKVVEGAGKRGIKVLLDQHRPDGYAQSKLWHTDKLTEDRWIADWVMLAKRYKGNDTVIGADLHNEPAGDATWGSGDPRTDWRMAAEKAGNAIHEVNPDWLIVVEGIEKVGDKDWYWMGGNLSKAGEFPVRLRVPNKLVYSAHDYGPGVYMQGWFQDKSFPANMPAIWDSHWGYLVKEGVAPVLLGEFGGRSVGSDTEGIWQRSLMDYLKENGISYTYWSLNPNSGDTGGVLADDWKSVNESKMSMLSKYQDKLMRVFRPAQMDTTAAPKAK